MPALVALEPLGASYWEVRCCGRRVAVVRRGLRPLAHVVGLLVIILAVELAFNIALFSPVMLVCQHGEAEAARRLGHEWSRGVHCPVPNVGSPGMICLWVLNYVLCAWPLLCLFRLATADPGITATPLTGPRGADAAAWSEPPHAEPPTRSSAASDPHHHHHGGDGEDAHDARAAGGSSGDVSAAAGSGEPLSPRSEHRRRWRHLSPWAIVPMPERRLTYASAVDGHSAAELDDDVGATERAALRPAGGGPTARLPSGHTAVLMHRKLCHACNAVRAPRTSHCAECEVCVSEFDHHCGVTQTCVGRGTIRPFLGFVGGLALLCDWVLLCCAAALYSGTAEGHRSVVEVTAIALIVVVLLNTLQLHAGVLLYGRLYVCLGVTLREDRKRGSVFTGRELARHYESECPCMRSDSACCCGCVTSDDEAEGVRTAVPRPFSRGTCRNAAALCACCWDQSRVDLPDGQFVTVQSAPAAASQRAE